jgi:hypothetical protein
VRFTELICRLAQKRFEGPAQVGARLSPVALRPEEASMLLKDAERLFGERRVYVSVSIPGVEPSETEHVCVDPTERAAERATRWRNTVDLKNRERVLYVSVVRQGKAGGLRDVLYELTEAELRQAFVSWATSPSALPEGLGAALQSAGIEERVDARSLCEFSEAVLKEKGAEAQWDAASLQLPLLSLIPDSNLRSAPTKRLTANARWVRDVAATERKVSSLTAPAKKRRTQLARAITQSAEDIETALGRIDLGDLSEADLSSDVSKTSRNSKKTRSKKPATKTATKPKKKARSAGTTREQNRLKRALVEGMPTPLPEPLSPEIAPSSTPRGELTAEETAAPAADRSPEPQPGQSVPTPSEDEAPTLDAPPPEPAKPAVVPAPDPERKTIRRRSIWTRAMQKREFGELPPLSPALLDLLNISLQSPCRLHYSVKRGPLRRLLTKRGKALPPPVRVVFVESQPGWAEARVAWEAAREVLAVQLSGDGAALEQLVGAPLVFLDVAEIRDAVEAYLAAHEALLDALSATGEHDLIEDALALETITISAESGDALSLFSPLHPLWLGQALFCYRQLADSANLAPTAKRLIARSLTQAPLGPRQWIDGTERSALVSGLLAYEADPAMLPDADLRVVVRRILERHRELHPYIDSGLRVVAEGANLAPVLEAVADLLDNSPVASIDLHLSSPTASDRISPELLRSGRLRLLPLQRSPDVPPPPPHLHFVISEQPEPEAVPSPPAELQLSALQSSSWLGPLGQLCRASSVEGVTGTRRIAEFLSPPDAADRAWFTEREERVDFDELFPGDPEQKITWRVALGPSLGGEPRRGEFLLTREEIDGVSIMITTKDERPLARSLTPVFQILGVQDLRPRTLCRVTKRLSESSRFGMLSLEASPERLISGQLLDLALSEALSGPCVIAPLRGEFYEVLLGEDDSPRARGSFSMALAPARGGLELALGYAAVRDPLPVETGGSRITGPLWDLLGRLTNAAQLLSERSAGGDAARALVRALMWPHIADISHGQEPLIECMGRLKSEVKLSLSVTCLLPAEHTLLHQQQPRVRGVDVRVIRLDAKYLERALF